MKEDYLFTVKKAIFKREDSNFKHEHSVTSKSLELIVEPISTKIKKLSFTGWANIRAGDFIRAYFSIEDTAKNKKIPTAYKIEILDISTPRKILATYEDKINYNTNS